MLFKRSQHGWRLLRQSLAIFREEKKMWVLSLLGRGFFFVIVVAILVVLWMVRSGKIDYTRLSTMDILWGYVVVLLALWFGNLVTAYFNAALTVCLMQYDNGQPVRLLDGCRAASRRFLIIFWWILAHFTFGGFVGLFRSKFKESGWVNQLLSGLSWPAASLLIPALVINEPASFMRTLRRSSQLMYEFAGQHPQVQYSYTWLNIGLRLAAIVPAIIGYQINTPASIAAGMTVSFLLLLGVGVMLNAVLVTILQGLYEYMAHHKTLRHFQTPDLATAIKSSIPLQ